MDQTPALAALPVVIISIDALASQAHAAWLAARDRSYSPFNLPWHQLTPHERKEISRSTAIAVHGAIATIRDQTAAIPGAKPALQITVHDEYANLWVDPVRGPR